MSRLWALAAQAGSASPAQRAAFRASLGDGPWIVLETCHRTEAYGLGAPPTARPPGVKAVFDAQAATRIIRIACGLESAIVGEDEVLHQVRQALKETRATRPLDHRVARLFETAVATGRKARAGRSAARQGLADRALEWLDAISALRGRPVLVAGAGHVGRALADAARRRGALVTVASRSRGMVDLTEGARLAPSCAGVAVAIKGRWEALEGLTLGLPPTADLSSPSALPDSVRATLNGAFLGIDDLFERPSPLDPAARAYVDQAAALADEAASNYWMWLAARG
jgi:glutamyl-tRNA reductase